MADAKLTALTAASALAGADLFYVSQSAASRKATGTQLLALVGTTYVPLAGGASMAGPLSIVNSTTQQIAYVYNTFTDASNYERLKLTGVAGTSVNLTAETLGTGGDNLDIVLTPAGTGKVRLPDGLATQLALCFTTTTNTGIFAAVSGTRFGIVSNGTFSLNVASNFISMPTASVLGWTSVGGADGSSIAAGLAYNAAGVVEVNSGTLNAYRDLKLRNLIQTEYSQLTEMTAPSAPATNSVRIYAEDNGAGKTRLMALFATGSAVQLGIEP